MYIYSINFSNTNFGNKRIESFSRENLLESRKKGESNEEFALRYGCSAGTVKRRAKEWGIPSYRIPQIYMRINIPIEDLQNSNNPNIQPEKVCVDNECGTTTLTRRKREANLPNRTSKKTRELSNSDIAQIYSGQVKTFLENGNISRTTYYRKLQKSNFVTPRKKAMAAAKKIDALQVKIMHDSGFTYQQIADFYGVSKDTLIRHI